VCRSRLPRRLLRLPASIAGLTATIATRRPHRQGGADGQGGRATGLRAGRRARQARLVGQQRGGVAQQVHDGDTVTVQASGNLGVRFLGVDAPEVSVPLPGTTQPFISLADARWQQVLTDPFAPELPPFTPPLTTQLHEDLAALAGPTLADNHARLGGLATKALETTVSGDLEALDKTKEDFGFFLAFAGEVMDRYGRLLAYLHPDPTSPASRPRSGSAPTTSGCCNRGG
jgi:hypothetical protein